MENQWQPMETAPKDGSKFLMFITGKEYRKYNRKFITDEKYRVKTIVKTIQKVLIAFYIPYSNCFYGEDGDYNTIINEFNFKEQFNSKEKDDFEVFCCDISTDLQATHWMPLPKPPVINN